MSGWSGRACRCSFLRQCERASVRAGGDGLDEVIGNGLVGAFFGNQQPACEVDGYPGAADEGEHGEGDPYDDDIDAEVLGDSGGDAGSIRAWKGGDSGGGWGGLLGSGSVYPSLFIPRGRGRVRRPLS